MRRNSDFRFQIPGWFTLLALCGMAADWTAEPGWQYHHGFEQYENEPGEEEKEKATCVS